MIVELAGDRYVVKMEAAESIEILINSTSIYTKTIGAGKEATIGFNLEERLIST